jgi:tetratricopeptide (TPR) repeat protein
MAELKLDEAPKKVRDFVDKGITALERGNLDYAIDMFSMALDMEPRLLKIREYLHAAALKKYRDSKPNSLSTLLLTIKNIGKISAARGTIKKDPLAALSKAEELMQISPIHPPFVLLTKDSAIAAEMPEVAVQVLELLREQNPREIKTLNLLIDIYREIGNTAKAAELAHTIVNLCPNDGKALKRYKDISALNTMNKGGWEKAGSYRDVMKNKEEATLLEQESAAVKSDSNLDTLIKNNEEKIAREPENINYRRALGDLYAKNKQFEKAITTLEEAQRLSGGSDPQIDRAVSEITVKKFDHELKQLEELGDTAGIETKKAAREAFRISDAAARVQRYPNDLQFKYDYGYLLFHSGQQNDAIQQFQQSQRNPQRRVQSLYYMGLCFKAKQQFDIAREQLEKAASELHTMDDIKKDIVYDLASVCEAMGDKAKATEYYKDIYSVDISYKDIAAKIEGSYKK